jgi:F-type H+-transporting ATPase subunit b
MISVTFCTRAARALRGVRLGALLLIPGVVLLAPALTGAAFAADDHGAADKHGAAAEKHGPAGKHAANDEHAAAGEHGGEHGEEPSINWFYGMLGESAEVEEPDWMYRSPGMPVPLAAQLINSAILLGLLYRFGKGPVQAGLRRRRDAIMQGIDQASKMKAEAAAQLADREAKLEQIEAEITRLKREMREAAQAERVAILAEAKRRRERMERDAKVLIEQELKAAREQLFELTVKAAVGSARTLISAKTTTEDDTRLGEEYLAGIKQSLARAGRQDGGMA